MATCAACGEDNPERARFCLACGAPLAAPGPAREERKRVSVLFADLVGFTSASERLDPEEVRAVQAPYWQRVKAEIERFGGTVEKFIGDAVMALFGAPTAHEDDPERAVRAALAIRDAIAGEGRLQVRVAITTGEALVALAARPEQGEGMASGDVVNTASRLQGEAPTNGILVDETTYRATRQAIDYREAEPVSAKGKSEPIAVWEAVEARWRFGTEVAAPARPLVGRAEEVDVLRDALARARRERSSQLVTLVGVPGIGKSRLVAELFRIVDEDPDLIYWRQGRSLPYGEGVTLWALGEMVKAHAGILETDSPDEAGRKLRDAVCEVIPDPVDNEWATGHLRPLVGLGTAVELTGDRRAEAFAAWRKFFEALAQRGPLVLVFEDLQWADDGLLEFVDHLVDWASGVPLLCVCTARPELLERRPDWGGGKRNAVTISLSPLSEHETAQLFANLLEQAVLPAEAQEVLLARAGGNPLYAEEFIRMLEDRGFLSRDGGVWRLQREGELPLPESVQGIIAARIDALPDAEKDLLRDAAVLGKVVWVGALAEIKDLARWTVEERLHALERKEFLRREQSSSVGAETEYSFRHVLVKDVAYGTIPRAQRADKHVRVAEWISSLSTRPEDHAELVAHHYLSALEYQGATPELAQRAGSALREAAERAEALSALDAAARFYAAALELADENDPERPRLELGLANARFSRWLMEDEELATAARDGFLAQRNVGGAADAELLLTQMAWYGGDRNRAWEHLMRADELVRTVESSPVKARVLSQLSRFHMLSSQVDETLHAGERALAMAEQLGLDRVRATVLINIGTARSAAGDRAGIPDIERGIEIARAAGDWGEVSRALNNLASVVVAFGELDRAWALYDESERLAREVGSGTYLRWVEGHRIHQYYWGGRWDEALEIASDFVERAQAGSPHYLTASSYARRASIRLARGDVGGAAEDAERALEFALAAGDPQVVQPTRAASSLVFLAAGRRTEVEQGFRRAADSQPAGRPSVGVSELCWSARELGFEDAVRKLHGRDPTLTPWLEAGDAILAGEAVRAADIFGEIGARPEEAYARLRSREPEQVERALDFYRSVGASAYIAEAEELLAASA